MKGLLSVVTALSAATLMAEPSHLETARTSLVVDKIDGSWRLLWFGERLQRVEDAASLVWSKASGYNSLGQRRTAPYLVYGSKNLPRGKWSGGINRWGGLKVTHADGSLTTELIPGTT